MITLRFTLEAGSVTCEIAGQLTGAQREKITAAIASILREISPASSKAADPDLCNVYLPRRYRMALLDLVMEYIRQPGLTAEWTDCSAPDPVKVTTADLMTWLQQTQ